MNPWHC